MLLRLIQEEFINQDTERAKDLRKRIVCAYLPGCPIYPTDITTNSYLKATQQPRDTKCVISWCTDYGVEETNIRPCHYFYADDARRFEVISGDEKSEDSFLTVNPLTWESSGDCEPKLNKGSMGVKEGVLYQKVCGAKLVNRDTCVRVTYDGKSIYDLANSNECKSDYLPFWMSIRMNAADRLQQWVSINES
ncbi:hypothetical protein RFI_02311 [Reticulomyxa filosa]|uniref:Uncharacterized protein n=1 Tax=Reticulomyxa filosa TaxID=46433 RepID=X6P8A1_RETFI|nr:hypothetical protein RFI_02311 [Reticulomyxa filosa]|eukprot:ETO34775.1 hypothetical protein RFI_02311 [Reticulomyxa filosa]